MHVIFEKEFQIISSVRLVWKLGDILKAGLRLRLQRAFGPDFKGFFQRKKL